MVSWNVSHKLQEWLSLFHSNNIQLLFSQLIMYTTMLRQKHDISFLFTTTVYNSVCLPCLLMMLLTLQCRFKPLEISKLVAPCREEFERLFRVTFSVKDNAQYLNNIQASVHNWGNVGVEYWRVRDQWVLPTTSEKFTLRLSLYVCTPVWISNNRKVKLTYTNAVNNDESQEMTTRLWEL